MSATVIEFPGARERDGKPTHNAKSARAFDENIAPLTDFEIAVVMRLRWRLTLLLEHHAGASFISASAARPFGP